MATPKRNSIWNLKPQTVKLQKNNLSTSLQGYLGKNISDVCSHSFTKQSDNHCAHFVSHVMGYQFGFTCKGMTGKGEGRGANIRVQEVFKKCPQTGEWDDESRPSGNCLAFVTSKKNVKGNIMTNVPRKHIGIYASGKIYHYSNSKNKVVSQTPKQFQRHYSGSDITVFYGTFPVTV